MTSKTLTLSSEDFFHARPAAQIADTAGRFESIVMIICDTAMADARDALSLMRLGHPDGAPLDVITDGPDEQNALEAVLGIMQKEFTIIR